VKQQSAGAAETVDTAPTPLMLFRLPGEVLASVSIAF